MTALPPERVAELEKSHGPRTVRPPEDVTPDRVRAETEAAAQLQRAVDEASADIRTCAAIILAAQVKKDRALERRANAVNALRAIGITPTLDSAGDAPPTGAERNGNR